MPIQPRSADMPDAQEVLKRLETKASSKNVEGMAKFGMTAHKRLGVSVPDMRKLAKEIGKDHRLALDLWKTGVPEARILAGMVTEPEKLTERQMESWVKGFNSWDACDQVCMNLFDKSSLALRLSRGGKKAYVQCLDPCDYTGGGTVIFQIERAL